MGTKSRETIYGSSVRAAAERAAEARKQADNLACRSWNERMWSDGGPIDPSPTIDQAINGGFPWLEIKCSRCLTPRDVDLAALPHVPTTCVHDLAGRLVCQKCARRPESDHWQHCSSLRRSRTISRRKTKAAWV
jgi:hypothetical protein